MADLFDKAPLHIPCPQCGKQIEQTLGWIKKHDDITCAACGNTFPLDKKQLTASLDRANKAVDSFRKSLRKFGK